MSDTEVDADDVELADGGNEDAAARARRLGENVNKLAQSKAVDTCLLMLVSIMTLVGFILVVAGTGIEAQVRQAALRSFQAFKSA